jgi:hypothetical protein
MIQETFDETVMARTSKEFYPGKVTPGAFLLALGSAIRSAESMDQIKSALFYGKNFQELTEGPMTEGPINHEIINPDLLHSIIGLYTECGELLERVLLMGTRENHEADKQNIVEEFGDIEWFLSLGRQALDLKRETILIANDLKLTKRYGPAFNRNKALDRNLSAEQEAIASAMMASVQPND